MATPNRSIGPGHYFHVEALAPGVTLRKLHPGGLLGPNRETRNDFPGGQTWSELIALGDESDDFIYAIPDIRLPANQIWPLHWHDCWTVVVIVEGSCQIGDWYMREGDVFVASPSIEYGPLVNGPGGCRMLEIFANLALAPGGYSPEYRDHPTLRGGNHVFKEREGVNTRNNGRSSLSVDGTAGMTKTRLTPGWSWDLGDPGDPQRGVIKNTGLAAGESMPAHLRGDWYAALVLGGSADVAGKTLGRDDVIIAERGGAVPEIVAGKDGVQLLENFRTSLAL